MCPQNPFTDPPPNCLHMNISIFSCIRLSNLASSNDILRSSYNLIEPSLNRLHTFVLVVGTPKLMYYFPANTIAG